MIRIWRISLSSALLWMALGNAEADFVGFNISPGQLDSSHSAYSRENAIELVDDLDSDSEGQNSMVLILEHPIRALPNIRYNQGLKSDSPARSAQALDNQSVVDGEEVSANYELDQDDIVLYYQLSRSQIDLDLGVDLKRFAGEVSFDGNSENRVDVDETIPLLYLSARYDLSDSGFYLGANINANIIDLGLSKSSAQDSTIMLGYDSGNGLGVEGGIKYFSLDLDKIDSQDSDLRYDGLFLNGYYNF